jgi:hypothetical protein
MAKLGQSFIAMTRDYYCLVTDTLLANRSAPFLFVLLIMAEIDE